MESLATPGHRRPCRIGRGVNSATASEGALKLKKVSYLHAEAYAAGEMKHGPIALLEPGFPVVAIVHLQMLARYVALARGCDVDKPRNLAKSVTVE